MALICFASPKGGVGKTTLAANVAHQLARGGLQVIALDLDPQNALRLHFGVPLQDTDGFTRLLSRQPDWPSYLREMPCGLSLLPYGLSGMDDAIACAAATAQTPALLQRPVTDILTNPDIYLVIDTPPGPSPLLAALLPIIDLLVTVLLVDAASVSLIPAIENGGSYGANHDGTSGPAMGFILNQFDPRTRLGSAIAEAATRHLGERLLGMVYRDGFVAEAVAAQILLADYAPASKANQDIVAVSGAILDHLRLSSLADGGGRGGRQT
jgi:cellulose synthase operon protein YhjQ